MKKIFYWMIGGIVLTVIAFFIPDQSGSMWPSVIASATMAFLYLGISPLLFHTGIFLAVWLPKINSSTKRKAIAGLFTVLFIFSIASAVISYEGSVQQRQMLRDIRKTVENSMAHSLIQESLIKTMAKFDSNSDQNVGNVFTSRYDSLITEDSLFTYGSRTEDQTLFLYLAKATADSVVLIGESRYIEGQKEDFKNFSGNKGDFQVQGILTSKGVDYERQN